MANYGLRATAAALTVLASVSGAKTVQAQPGGYAASQDSSFQSKFMTGGSSTLLTPDASVAFGKAGGTFEQGTAGYVGAMNGGSFVGVTPNLNLGPAAGTQRGSNVGGFAASQDTSLNVGKMSGGAGALVAPAASVALGRAGGTFEQGTAVDVGAMSGGAQTLIAPTLKIGPAASSYTFGN